MEKLLKKWKDRATLYRGKAEEAFFASQTSNATAALVHLSEQHHWDTCLRQWDSAIEELEQVLNNNEK